jgi:hypothetical protein
VQAADASALTDANTLYANLAAKGGALEHGTSGASKQSVALGNQAYDLAQQPVANLAAGENYVSSVLGGGDSQLPTLADLPPNLQADVNGGTLTLSQAIAQAIKNRPAFAAQYGAAVAAAGGPESAASAALAYNPVAQALYNQVTSPTGTIATENNQLQQFYQQGGGSTPAGLGNFAQTGIIPDATDPNSPLGAYENALLAGNGGPGALGTYDQNVLSGGMLNPSTNPALAGVITGIQNAEQLDLNKQIGALTGQANKMGMYGSSGFAVGEGALDAQADQLDNAAISAAEEAEYNEGIQQQETTAGQLSTQEQAAASDENSANQAALSAGTTLRGQNLSALGQISANNATGLGVQQNLSGQLGQAQQTAVGEIGQLSADQLAPITGAANITQANDRTNEQAGAVNAQVSLNNANAPETALNNYLSQLNLLGGQDTSTTNNSTTGSTHDVSATGATDPTAAAITGGLGGALGAYGLVSNSTGGNLTGAPAPGSPGGVNNPLNLTTTAPSIYATNPTTGLTYDPG